VNATDEICVPRGESGTNPSQSEAVVINGHLPDEASSRLGLIADNRGGFSRVSERQHGHRGEEVEVHVAHKRALIVLPEIFR